MVPHETVNFANFGFSQVAFPAFPHHFCGILFYSILFYSRSLLLSQKSLVFSLLLLIQCSETGRLLLLLLHYGHVEKSL